MRNLTHLPEIAEGLRELEEGLASGRSRDAIAEHLNVSRPELERIERSYGGLSVGQLERMLELENEVERLREKIERLEEERAERRDIWMP